jgi:hypothetical protein
MMNDVFERLRRLGLLDPTDQEVRQRRMLASRLAGLHGKVAGFLDNRKQNANILLQHIAARLSAECGIVEAWHRSKFIYSRLAEPIIIDEMAERCDFVVAAIGD